MWRHEINLLENKILCIKLVNYLDKYTEMHSQQNIKKKKKFSKCYVSARYDVLTVVLLKIQVFRVVTPCNLVNNILGMLGPNGEDATIFGNV